MINLYRILLVLILVFNFKLVGAQIQYAMYVRIESPDVGFSDGKIVSELLGNYPNPVEFDIQLPSGNYTVTDSLINISYTEFDDILSPIGVYAKDILTGDTLAHTYAVNVPPGFDFILDWFSFAGPSSEFVCDGQFNGTMSSTSLDSVSVKWSEYYDSNGGTVDLQPLTDLNMIGACEGFHYLTFFTSLGDPMLSGTSLYFEPLTGGTGSIDAEVFSTPSATDSCTGSAIATVIAGTGPFQYFWDLQSGINSADELCPGLHSLKVIDANSDSTMVLFGIADSGSFYNYSDTTLVVVDTLYFMTEDCGIDYSSPIDSVFISFVDFYSSTSVAVGFTILQGANTFYVQDTSTYDSVDYGIFLIDLTQFCLNKSFGSHLFKFRDNLNTFLSADELKANQICVYPNPSNGLIKIIGENVSEIFITDLTGNSIISTNSKEIDVSHLSPGVYLISICSGQNHYSVQKLIIN